MACALVFWGWYPTPWWKLLGVEKIFIMMVGVDLVCGPLLTLLIAKPSKSRRQLLWDLLFIAVVQLSALAYGVWSMYQARPVALVYEVDRFTIIAANEIQKDLLEAAPAGLRKIPNFGVSVLSLRAARTAEEYLSSIQLSIQGVTQAMRPNWWTRYDESAKASAMTRAKPIEGLINSNEKNKRLVEERLELNRDAQGDFFYLPLTSTKKHGWAVILNAKGEIIEYVEIDGFE